ncbi:MAG: amino acid ABC transporter ATP-binding protein [Candidatus Nucleicultricaceae bacterium]
MIELKEVDKHFGDFKVLKNINLTINKRDIIVICGPSGSGKSTLIRTINGLEEIQRGEITLDGKSIALWDAIELRKEIGMVFQDFALFQNMTVLENIIKPQTIVLRRSYEKAEAMAEKMLAIVRLLGHEHKYPAQLSGGQQQRAAIARALAMEPNYLLFDEPTSALDPEMVADVLDVMEHLAKQGMTMVVVSHEMGFARSVSNRVVFMENGEIIEDTTNTQFFKNPQSKRAREFLGKVLR